MKKNKKLVWRVKQSPAVSASAGSNGGDSTENVKPAIAPAQGNQAEKEKAQIMKKERLVKHDKKPAYSLWDTDPAEAHKVQEELLGKNITDRSIFAAIFPEGRLRLVLDEDHVGSADKNVVDTVGGVLSLPGMLDVDFYSDSGACSNDAEEEVKKNVAARIVTVSGLNGDTLAKLPFIDDRGHYVTLRQLKQRLEKLCGIPWRAQRLFLDDRELEDVDSASDITTATSRVVSDLINTIIAPRTAEGDIYCTDSELEGGGGKWMWIKRDDSATSRPHSGRNALPRTKAASASFAGATDIINSSEDTHVEAVSTLELDRLEQLLDEDDGSLKVHVLRRELSIWEQELQIIREIWHVDLHWERDLARRLLSFGEVFNVDRGTLHSAYKSPSTRFWAAAATSGVFSSPNGRGISEISWWKSSYPPIDLFYEVIASRDLCASHLREFRVLDCPSLTEEHAARLVGVLAKCCPNLQVVSFDVKDFCSPQNGTEEERRLWWGKRREEDEDGKTSREAEAIQCNDRVALYRLKADAAAAERRRALLPADVMAVLEQCPPPRIEDAVDELRTACPNLRDVDILFDTSLSSVRLTLTGKESLT
ncbi:unnamed protein product [Amoebophrya sp. A25]|nr:unnamed protein product [Amoebophrya sp. A25]|eukprot:GSA25T00013281001.1